MYQELMSGILWEEISEELATATEQNRFLYGAPMEAGLEAEVFKVGTALSAYVLKVWNRASKPDVAFQYHLLKALHHRGIAVSRPLGWGFDGKDNPVLLTVFSGVPIGKVNKKKLIVMAELLAGIHQFPKESWPIELPRYDFVDYFFPGIEEHPDLKERLLPLVRSTKMEQSCLIHGDYNLGNLLEAGGEYSIIDWTNGQLGDPRYDAAWSIILIGIYLNERYCSIYRSVFLAALRYSQEELEKFEAMALIRWILLSRTTNLPRQQNTAANVRDLLLKNKYVSIELV